jgi:chromate transporter
MLFLQLFWVYIKIGLFNFGGGYAMLSLIQDEVVDRHGWITMQEFTDIVAISQMTPGPIGINSATYVGYTAVLNAGYSPQMAVLGSCLATLAVCLPSLVLILIVSYYFVRFKQNKYVEAAFLGLRPATVGLIAAAALLLMNTDNFIDFKSLLLFAIAFLLTWKYKLHPILTIALSALAGLLLYFQS